MSPKPARTVSPVSARLIDPKGRVLFENPLEGRRKLLFVVLTPRRDRHLRNRVGEADRDHLGFEAGCSQRRSGMDVLRLGDSGDVAADHLFGVDVFLPHEEEEVVHPHMPAAGTTSRSASPLIDPEKTRNIEMRPTKGSLTVLKT